MLVPNYSKTLIFITLILGLSISTAASEKIEEIQVTASRGNTQITDVVNSVSVLNSVQLKLSQSNIITDALQGAPGVFIQQTTAGQGTVIVRGLKGSEVLHLVDGMRLNNALFRNAPNQYLALVDPWIVNRTEIVRGPLSSIYGSDAMGGVVHLLTDQPEFDSQNYTHKIRSRLAYDSSTLGKTFNTSFASGKQNLALGGSFSYQDFDDLRASNRRIQSPSDFSARSAALFGNFSDTNNNDWGLSVQFLEQPNTPRYDELVPGFEQTQAASEEFSFIPNSRFFVHAKHSSSGYGKWAEDFKINLALQKIRDGRRTQDTGSIFLRTEDNQSSLLGLTLQANSSDIGNHALSYGLDLYYDKVTSMSQQIDVLSGDIQSVQARFPDGSTLSNFDAYLHDRIKVNSRMHFDTGLRMSKAEVNLSATEDTSSSNISNFDVSGSFGAHYSFSDSIIGIANLARGFRAPNIFDLGTLGARPGNRFNIANTQLSPETVVTGEIGLRFNQATSSIDAAIWLSDYQDKIVSVSTGDINASGRDIVQSQNASEVSLYGAELSGNWNLNDFHSLQLNLSYTHGEAEFSDSTKEPADRIPPLNGKASWNYNNEKWWFGSDIFFASEQNRLSARDIRDPRINPLGTSGWGIINILWGMDINEHWALNTRFNNILDKYYRSHGSGIDAAGRHLKFSIEHKF